MKKQDVYGYEAAFLIAEYEGKRLTGIYLSDHFATKYRKTRELHDCFNHWLYQSKRGSRL